jgi:hypothetical protein
MAERLYRTQILLEPVQHRALREMAEREGRSVSDVVREMIRRELDRTDDRDAAQRRLAALEKIQRDGDEMVARRGGNPWRVDVAELINELREERVADTRRERGGR